MRAVVVLMLAGCALFANPLAPFLQTKEQSVDIAFSAKLIEKTTLKIDTSRLDKSNFNDEYEIKIYPKSFETKRLEAKLFDIKREKLRASTQKMEQKRLQQQIERLVQTLLLGKELTLLSQQKTILQQQIDVGKSSAQKESDIVKLFDKKESLDALTFAINAKTERFERQKRSINSALTHKVSSLAPYIQSVDYMMTRLCIEHNENLSDALKSQEAELEAKLERSKDALWVKSFDIKYEHDERIAKAFSVGLSFSFAFEDIDDVDKKLKALEAKSAYAFKKEQQRLAHQEDYYRLHQLYKGYLYQSKKSYSAFKTKLSAKARLKVELKEVNKALESLKVQKKLYRALIDFHAQNGTLKAQTILKAMP